MAEETGNDEDPLEQPSEIMSRVKEKASEEDDMEADPFEMYMSKVVDKRNLSKSRHTTIERSLREWSEFMESKPREASCPTEQNIWSFVESLEEKNSVQTIKVKLRAVNNAYEFLQKEHTAPHPTTYNPFEKVLDNWNPDKEERKDYPPVELDDIRECLPEHYRDRLIVFLQLKLGLRRGEVGNIKIADVHIDNDELERHYPSLGKNTDYDNSIIIPDDRDGNKSSRTRVLPLDDELRKVILRYLLVRPNVNEPWLLLSKKSHVKLSDNVCSNIWNEYFQEIQLDGYRSISSHYGRHFFTTYFTVKKDWNSELVGYMRGDTKGESLNGTIKYYIHTYYQDIETDYRNQIFKLER
ncbi:site-specific integrase [Haloterrigena salinisoli]|uniref:tyrosine-type recombinase/integrase n=1 Tax=Haloterrigena salinisoli TaxID=3132747 RepID=UPI0030D4AD66